MNPFVTYLFRISVFLTMLSPGLASGQKPRVSNVRLELDATRAKIIYDLADNLPSDSIYIQVEQSGSRRLNAKTVTGDIGKGIPAGKNKTAYWDYRLDGLTLTETDKIRAEVILVSERLPGGPANALLSVLLPGLGNIMVQPAHKPGLRPLISVGYGSLLTYGLIQKSRANQQYKLYQNQLTAEDAEPYYQESARLRHHYLITTRAAAAVLVADVIYTFLKGRRNLQQGSVKRVAVNYVGKTPTIGIQLTF